MQRLVFLTQSTCTGAEWYCGSSAVHSIIWLSPHLLLTSIWKLSSYKHSLCILISLAFRKVCSLAWYPGRPGTSHWWITLSFGCAKMFSGLLGLKTEETLICFTWIHIQLALDALILNPGKLFKSTEVWFFMKSLQLKSWFWPVMSKSSARNKILYDYRLATFFFWQRLNTGTSILFWQFISLSAPLAPFLTWFYVNFSVYNPCGVTVNLCNLIMTNSYILRIFPVSRAAADGSTGIRVSVHALPRLSWNCSVMSSTKPAGTFWEQSSVLWY